MHSPLYALKLGDSINQSENSTRNETSKYGLQQKHLENLLNLRQLKDMDYHQCESQSPVSSHHHTEAQFYPHYLESNGLQPCIKGAQIRHQ